MCNMRTASETWSENTAVAFVDASIDLLDAAHGAASLSSDTLKFAKQFVAKSMYIVNQSIFLTSNYAINKKNSI